MDNRPDKSNKRTNQLINGLIIFGLAVLLFLILVGVFGKAGEYVKNFFVGVFGYAIYGYSAAFILIGILMMIGWSSSDTKIGVKLSFGALIAMIIAMCHIGASRELAAFGYGEYLKQCYLTHSTAGGILGGIFFYPLTKVFLFSMIFLGLFVAGIVALLIVMHINYELIVPTKSHKVKVFNKKSKSKKEDNIYNSEYNDYSEDNDNYEQNHVLYNGTVQGKSLPDNFSKSKNNDFVDYTPMDSFDQIERQDQEENIYDKNNDKNKKNVQKSNVRDDLTETQQEAIKILYDNSDIQYGLPTKKHVDVTNTMNQIKKNKKSEAQKPVSPSNDKVEDTQKKEEKTTEINEKYKFYTNNFRKNQVLENMGVIDNESHEDNTEELNEKQSDEDFLSDIEKSLNSALDEAHEEVEKTQDTISEPEIETNEESIIEEEKTADVTTNNNGQINLDDIDKPREESKFKLDEDKLRQDRLNELRAKKNNVNPVPIISNIAKDNKAEGTKKPEVKQEPKRNIKPYVKPSLDCLEDYDSEGQYDEAAMQEKCNIFESKMADAGIDVCVQTIVKGPAFSRIEFTTNTTLSKIIAHTKDISMWLSVESMRLEAPIPGRNCCGIEIPNDQRGSVGLKTIITSKEFEEAKPEKGLYFALGQDIEGKNYVSNICEFPHALVAGASGSGKSVCLNCLICSMLYKYSPEDLRFILVDPKVVELNVYKNIPHLLIPEILSDEKKVIKALKWLCVEMERRYEVLEEEGVSKLEQYNRVVKKEDKLPNILVVIDEVGDIMTSSVKKEFEQLVKKLAQKARAAGIYLILATQRPSVDVITGTIKANLPTRIAFTVTSGVDSKTILDTVGAEKLLRYGDMLYKESSKPSIVRVQGAYIDIVEIKKIVNQVRENNEVYYDNTAFDAINQEDDLDQSEDSEKNTENCPYIDELCPEVLRFGLQDPDLSTSKIQRQFYIGFNRAARIAEWMKSNGYLEEVGNKKRFVLSEEEVEQIIFNTENGIEGDNDNSES